MSSNKLSGSAPKTTCTPFSLSSCTIGSSSFVLKSFTTNATSLRNKSCAVAVPLFARPKTNTFLYGNGCNLLTIMPPQLIFQLLQRRFQTPKMLLRLAILTNQAIRNGDGVDSF